MHSSMKIYICTHPCNHHSNQNMEHFQHPEIPSHCLPISSHHSQVATILISVIIDKFHLFCTYKWKQPVCTFLCQIFSIQHYVWEIHPYRIYHSFFSIAMLFSIVWIYHSLFTHSVVDGNLGCLQLGAIKNNIYCYEHSLHVFWQL